MFKMKITALALGVALSGSVAAAGDLAGFHAALGGCAVCHDTNAVTAANVPDDERALNQKCETCHGDYKALAEKTKDLRFNPHASHLGDINCTVCHAAHEKPKLACNDCHTFDMKLPFADAAAKENWDKGVDEAAVAKALAEAPRETVDVLVIGAGSTGYNAAISAKRAGA